MEQRKDAKKRKLQYRREVPMVSRISLNNLLTRPDRNAALFLVYIADYLYFDSSVTFP